MERCGKMSRLQWQMQSFLYFLAKEFASFVHKLIALLVYTRKCTILGNAPLGLGLSL